MGNQIAKIEEEMKVSYLDYAMSVIIGRALPDVRDGLKPVQRRILYAMFREGLLPGKKYSKCAGVVGEVLKKYHPHGDTAVYDALVRMAQEFNMRYPLIDGQGNFGSIDGDPPAAYRYTEARLAKIAEEMLEDIDKETIDYIPNFDETTTEPIILPSKIPNLLINGSSGIAVGMATNIPPHNLGEIIDASVKLLENQEVSIEELMEIIKGPDFPTGGIIYGKQGIRDAYMYGKGLVKIRARARIERDKKGERIIISEIPYQVNKSSLVRRIAELIKERKLEGISDLRDESDRDGIRIVIELKKGEYAQVILNNLYKHTQMESTFGIIMLCLVNGQPRILNLKKILNLFLQHRKDVVIRRTTYDLKRAEERAHILEGLKTALEYLDEIIALIRKSTSPEEAKTGLIGNFSLTEIQAQAILDMKLQRLTALERDKIISEYNETLKEIKRLKEILMSEKLLSEIVKNELLDIKTRYGDERRTEVMDETKDITIEDLITEEESVITISHQGYVKRNPISVYRSQRRGGKGLLGMETKEEDYVSDLYIGSTHDYILFFTNRGRLYWLKVYQIPEAGRASRGKSIVNLIPVESDEKVTTAIVTSLEKDENQYLVFFTKKGIVKKTDIREYSNPRGKGIIAMALEEKDELIAVRKTDGNKDLIIGTKKGLAIRFPEKNVRPVGRVAKGVIGIRLTKGDEVVSADVAEKDTTLLTLTERGYGKRTVIDDYPLQRRGGKGVISIKITEKGGNAIGVLQVRDEDEIMLITTSGKLIRTKVKSVPVQGRSTQGVKLMDVEPSQKVVSIGKILERENGDEEVGG